MTDSHESPSPAGAEIHGDARLPEGGAPPPFLVVAVGASAGGLEAFSNLIQRLPADAPLALVLVQHLARNQKSLLPEILARRTALKVVQAEDGVAIQPAHVFVIPPNAHLTAIDGQLRIHPRPQGPGDAPVDVLFRSFAESFGERAVGVVLTGADADGSAGLREIRGAGGITIAQSPDEAQIDSMPRSAISTGVVDLVLPVEQIASELLRLSGLPLFQRLAPSVPEAPGDGEDELAAILRVLRRRTGIDFSQYKRPTISRRVARRMALRRVSQLADYFALLQDDPSEAESLQEDVLIHVTSFFREPDSFQVLVDSIFPVLLAKREEPLRIWVPGCSTGEEVYSLAISLFELLNDEAQFLPIQLFGTDVSNKSIEAARLGLYPHGIAADVSSERLRRYFTRTDGGSYRINKSVRDCCIFARQNVTSDPPFSRIDLIVCRNTLIYLGQPIQRKVMALFHYALQATGYLMLGRAETVGASADLFSVVDKKFKIYTKKPGAVRPELQLGSLPHLPSPQIARLGPRHPDVLAEANRLLLERYAPPSVVVDSTFQIVRSRGSASEFFELPSGEAGADALKTIKEELLVGFRSALHEAHNTQARARREGLSLDGASDSPRVAIDVTPFGAQRNLHYLVLFEASDSRAADAQPSAAEQPERRAENRVDAGDSVARLRRELASTRERLRANVDDLASANEELQSANEEILSSNEELQSTNEELDTAKEELQSTNEELSTLNDELHGRNEQLTTANSDLENLLVSVQIPIVMVSSDLRIRRFTPAAERILNLIPTDAGRPIGHINPNISCPDLEVLINEVIQTLVVRQREVVDRDGRAYSMLVRPYKTLDGRSDGAVLTLFDISASKDAFVLAQETGEAIMSTVREPILLLSADLRVTRANRAFREQFRMAASDIEGRFVYDLGDRQWDIPELRRLLEKVLPEHKNFQDFPVEHEFAGVGSLRMLLDGRRIESAAALGSVILLVIRQERGDA